MRRRIFTVLFTVIGALILCCITWFYLTVQEDTRRWKELCDPHRGWGQTTVDFQVLDKNNNQPLDSVKLTIRYGASGDEVIDTVLRQNGRIKHSFLIPQIDECEPYWAEISHPKYYDSHSEWNDTTSALSIKNGKVNEHTFYLKPATHIKVRVYNKLVAGDTLRLFVNKNIEKRDIWDYFTTRDFQQRNWTGYQVSIESGTTYSVVWIYQYANRSDTTLSKFYAVPFDTVKVAYTVRLNK